MRKADITLDLTSMNCSLVGKSILSIVIASFSSIAMVFLSRVFVPDKIGLGNFSCSGILMTYFSVPVSALSKTFPYSCKVHYHECVKHGEDVDRWHRLYRFPEVESLDKLSLCSEPMVE